MSNYWKEFYDLRLKNCSDDPFVQVGRTLNQKAMSEELFNQTANRFMELLEIEKEHAILDFCCGNGLFTKELALRGATVTGVDFNADLISGMVSRSPENVNGIVADALSVDFRAETYHRILFSAALQHFSLPETIQLFYKLKTWLKSDGMILITDIPDNSKIWQFYDNKDREDVYFENTLNQTPTLGTWFERQWLKKLARHAGFTDSHVLEQPDEYWYSHYRFDLILHN